MDTLTRQTDEQLIELCKKGDDDAFQELMRRYLKPIYNFVRNYAHTTDDTEDITQDTFFKAWRSVRKFKTGYTFKSWIYTIARNTALDHIKKKRSTLFSDLDDIDKDGTSFSETIEDTAPLASDVFDSLIASHDIITILNTLHPDYRSTLILHYYENMTFEEIALVMNKPMNTVKSWHRRAIESMRVQLAPKSTFKS